MSLLEEGNLIVALVAPFAIILFDGLSMSTKSTSKPKVFLLLGFRLSVTAANGPTVVGVDIVLLKKSFGSLITLFRATKLVLPIGEEN